MAENVTTEFLNNGGVNEMNGVRNSLSSKEKSTQLKSPRGPLSPEGRLSSASDVHVEQNYEMQKCENVISDMKSSHQSLSRRKSFVSGSDESRMDSELKQVAGGRIREKKIVKGEVGKRTRGDSSREAPSSILRRSSSEKNIKKLDKVNEIHSPISKIRVKSSQLVFGLEISSKSRPKAKSPSVKLPADKMTDESPVRRQNKPKHSSLGRSASRKQNSTQSSRDKTTSAPILLKQARDLISSGENPTKALEFALEALKLFEKAAKGKPNLDVVMCLHVTAAIYCNLGQYNEAIPILERSIEIPVIEEGQQHPLAKFAGHMQLGDTYALLGHLEKSVMCYNKGLELQKQVLGEADPRVGETCRYVAEANVQALQLDEAERLCQMALDIHRANGSTSSLEEAADRRLMGLICETKGNHEAALEHLVKASLAMLENGQEMEVAAVDCSIGDTYKSLARYDEAVFAYEKALKVFKASKGENHPAVASVFVHLAELHNRTWKMSESKSYCEKALRIYENPMPGVPPEDIASGLMNVSAIYESMNELDQALKLLHKAHEILSDVPGQQSTIAGIEAQMGVIYYVLEKYDESYNAFKNAISKLRATGEKKTAFFGLALNQMGLVCVQLDALSDAAELFEEARIVLKKEFGPYHPETLVVCSNLAGTYDAIDRVDDAINILEYIVAAREEKIGTANGDVVDEYRRLNELLKEAGRVRIRKGRSLGKLLHANVRTIKKHVMI